MELKKLTKYRNVWMALAILWVVFFHSELTFESSLISNIKLIGYGGVDIFVFASGMGCYLSLSKNEDILAFYKKRIQKIIPLYWFILIPWLLFKVFSTGITLPQVFGNLFCVQSFNTTGNDFNWYISAMWLYYLLIPVFFFLVKNIKKTITYWSILLLTIMLSFSFINSINLIIIFTRIPVLFLGICLGKCIHKGIKLRKVHCIAAFLASVAGFLLLAFFIQNYEAKLWVYGLWWYPFIFITPGLCLLISFVCCLLDKIKPGQFLLKGLECIGNHTFEIYLIHILFFEAFKYCARSGYVWNCNRNWILLLLLTGVASALFALGNMLVHKMAARHHKK